MRKVSVVVFILIIILFSSALSIPRLITYQGRITDNAGLGITDTVQIVFRLFNSDTGNIIIWEELHAGVTVHKGLFDVILGSLTPLDLAFDIEYWLEIWVDGDHLEPRVMLTASPYAFRAAIADSVVGGSGTGGGAAELDDLNDVSTTGVVNGQVLKWMDVPGEWRPANDIGGAGTTDNWGTQVAITDPSLIGDGTLIEPLGLNWDTLYNYINQNIILDDLANVNSAGVEDGYVLTWVEAVNQWRPTSVDSGGIGDNWGTQVVIHDNSLFGNGSIVESLSVNWDTLTAYVDTYITLNHLQDVLIDSVMDNQVLGWNAVDSVWKPVFDFDDDFENELIDQIIWEPVDSLGSLHNTLRIIENSIEWDITVPVTQDSLEDNSISDLGDVQAETPGIGDLLQYTNPHWSNIPVNDFFNNHNLRDFGDVQDTTPPLGGILVYTADSNWTPLISIFDIISLWYDEGDYIEPLDTTAEIVDFRIYDRDTTWLLQVRDLASEFAGEWYGMQIERWGPAASDGYGLWARASTAEGVAPGSEFYGVKGVASGGSMVYGLYGDGDDPGAEGIGYGVYGRGHDAGGYFYGPDNDGEKASLKLQTGSQYMLLDGNEIDAVNDLLYLQNNTGSGVVVRNGGFSIGGESSDNNDLLLNHAIQLATDSLLGSDYHDHTGALIYSSLNSGWGTGKLHINLADDWRSYHSESALEIGQYESGFNGQLGVGTYEPEGKFHVAPTNDGTLDQHAEVGGYVGAGGTRWQSFTAGMDGFFIKVGLYLWTDIIAYLRIYEGEGTGGTLIAEQVENRDIPGWDWYYFTFNDPAILENGSVYTIVLTAMPDSGTFAWGIGAGNPYAGGRSNGDPDKDFMFETYMSGVKNTNFVVTEEGKVGIGTTNPEATLEVHGTVHLFSEIQDIDEDVEYYAETDGFLVFSGERIYDLVIFADEDPGLTSPNDIYYFCTFESSHQSGTSVPVPAGYYFKFSATPTSSTIGWWQKSWIPMGK
ncbi:hypothetical protein JW877_08020 [bacterium]|nr:hypothetical protein [bacterium]